MVELSNIGQLVTASDLSVTSLPSVPSLSSILFVLFLILLGLVLGYLFFSFAFFAIGKKAKLSAPGIAWIPGIGPTLIAYSIAKMRYWPWIVFGASFLGIFFGILFVSFGSAMTLLLILGALLVIFSVIGLGLFGVVSIIWQWKMFVALGRPGYWAIVPVIFGAVQYFFQLIGFIISSKSIDIFVFILSLVGMITYIVLVGITAWGNAEGLKVVEIDSKLVEISKSKDGKDSKNSKNIKVVESKKATVSKK